MDKLCKQVQDILKTVYEWVDNGCPGDRDLNMDRFKNNINSPLINVGE
jgi:hypothetical protein